jgi:hypothetical protein
MLFVTGFTSLFMGLILAEKSREPTPVRRSLNEKHLQFSVCAPS